MLHTVDVTWGYDPDIKYTKVEYKKSGDTTYTTPTTSTNPTTENFYKLQLEDKSYYSVKLTEYPVCCCTPIPREYIFYFDTANVSTTTTTSTTSTSTTTTIFIPPVQQTFTGLASPKQLVYNTANSTMYYIDGDAPHSLIRFDPATAQTVSDFVEVDPTNIGMVKPVAIVLVNNKLYFQGDSTGGMMIVDCASNTLTKTIAYGNDGPSKRQNIYVIDNIIYAYGLDAKAFITIDPTTDTTGSNFILDQNTTYNTASLVDDTVNSKIWALQSDEINSAPARAISYLKSDLTTVVDIINNISVKQSQNGKVDIGAAWYDTTTHEIWFVAVGDNTLNVINTDSASLTHQIPIPNEGFLYTYLQPSYFQKNDTLYITGIVGNSPSDTNTRTYTVDRANYALAGVNDTQINISFAFADSTGFTYTGVPGKSSPDAGYLTDGEIIVYG